MEKRKTYSAELKAKVALAAIKEERTINEIASEYEIHPNLVTKWKREALANLAHVFEAGNKKKPDQTEVRESELFKQIGQMKVEIDWLKKKLGI